MLLHLAVVAANEFGRSADFRSMIGFRPFPAGACSVQLHIDGRLGYLILQAVFVCSGYGS